MHRGIFIRIELLLREEAAFCTPNRLFKVALVWYNVVGVFKRRFMKMTIFRMKGAIVVFLLCGFCLPSFAQSLLDSFFSQGFFKDHFTSREESEGQDVEFQWKEAEKAHVLLITPKTGKDTPLDIAVEKGFVKVSGKVVRKETVERDGVKSLSSYLSQFSLSQGIPEGADWENVKMEQVGQSVQMTFPKKSPGRQSPKLKGPQGLKDLSIFGEKNLRGKTMGGLGKVVVTCYPTA